MIYTLLFSLGLIAVAVALLCIKILLVKNGKFPNTHIEANPLLRSKGIHCVKSQDLEARGSK